MISYTEKREDRRVSRTKRALKECFLQQLQAKPLQQISVSELCRLTDLNRSTFYAHFSDIYVLLDELKLDLLNEVDRCSKAILADRHISPEGITGMIFTLIARNRILLKSQLLVEPDTQLRQELNRKVQDLFYSKLFQEHPNFAYINQQELSNALLFLSHGFYAIYERWLSEDCKTSIENITRIALRLTTNCIQAFEEETVQ